MNQNMTYIEFVDAVKENIKNYISINGEVKIDIFEKTNEVKRIGLTSIQSDNAVAPVIYLDGFYQTYIEEHQNIYEVFEKIGKLYNSATKEKLDVKKIFSYIEKYDTSEIIPVVLDKKLNQNKLDLPHVSLYDEFMIIGKYKMSDGDGALATVTITEGVLDIMGVTEKDYKADLLRIAMMQKYNIEDMVDLMGQSLGEADLELSNSGMYVISNETTMFGATVIANKEYFKQILENTQTDKLYILPSSIHEVIAVVNQFEDENTRESLKEMVAEVNNTQVAEDEILSYNILEYTLADDKIRVI